MNDLRNLIKRNFVLPFRSIQNYSRRTPRFDYGTLLLAFQDFVSIFFLSLATGAILGCITALISFSETVNYNFRYVSF